MTARHLNGHAKSPWQRERNPMTGIDRFDTSAQLAHGGRSSEVSGGAEGQAPATLAIAALGFATGIRPRASARFDGAARSRTKWTKWTRACSWQQHYSPVAQTEMRRGIAKIISLRACGRRWAQVVWKWSVSTPKTKKASWALTPNWPILLSFFGGRCRD